MERIEGTITAVSDWLWGFPLILLLAFAGVFLTVRLGFIQFRYPIYTFRQTIGRAFSRRAGASAGSGTISPLQSLTTALASTVGAANIVGVPVAIMFGGPGAVFWMWMIALIGMATKFAECTLGVRYRERNEAGEYVGGPMYYITRGLGMRWLGVWFAVAFALEIVPSVMVQGNSVASSASETFGLPPFAGGLLVMVIVGAVVIGGIKRIGTVTAGLVPLMAGIYLLGAGLVIIANFRQVPEVVALIFSHAFQPVAAAGGFGGAVVAEALRWGFARGLYSNEAGLGTAPIAHAAATTDHPVRQGLWAMTSVVFDTLIICSATAFVVLSSGVWNDEGAEGNAEALTTLAFTEHLGPMGGYLVSVCLIFFVVSTIIVVIHYGEKQIEFLFGLRPASLLKYVYVAAILVGAVGGGRFIWSLLDIMLAAMLIPNIIALLLLSSEVRRLMNEFFKGEKYYLKDTGRVPERPEQDG